jgi:outer membrane protein assembly factor BamB
MLYRISTYCLLLFPIVALAGEQWPQFRGPSGDGHSDAKNVPTKWAENKNIKWKVAVHDKGWSSPVVWGKQVWVTTATAKGDKYYAVCFERDTGKVIYDLLLFELGPKETAVVGPTPFEDWEKYNSHASPTPLLEEGRIYVHFGASGTACIDTTNGKVLWKQTELKCNHHRGAGSSPIFAGDLVILTFDGFDVQFLVALNKSDGKIAWKQDRKLHPATMNGDLKKAYSTPLLIELEGKKLIVSPSAGATAAYDAKTGAEVWRVLHGGMNASLRPVFGHGMIFTASSDGGKQMVAVKVDGKGDVTNTHTAWTFNKGAPNRSSFLLTGDHLLMVNSGGIASCVSVKDGKELNKTRLDPKANKFTASPILVDKKWYVFDEDGNSFVLSADENLKILETNKLASGCKASPAAVDGQLFVRTLTHLYCLENK